MPRSEPFQLADARVCAILNKNSGKKRGQEIEAELQDRLAPQTAHFEMRRPAHSGQIGAAAARAVRDDFDLILAIGGDGTQAAIAQEVAGTDKVMGVIPAGTFNYFSRELGCGETVSEGIDTILNARPARIGVGQVNGRVFLNNVSFGAYPEILQRRESLYRRWGRSRAAAYWSVIVALADMRRPLDLTAEVHGAEMRYHTALAFVAKSAYQLESFGLDEGAHAVRDGRLALFIARAEGPVGLIRAALRLAFGLTARDSDFDLITSDEIEIEAGPASRLVAHDGEKSRMKGPFKLRVLPDALTVLVPAVGGGHGRASDP